MLLLSIWLISCTFEPARVAKISVFCPGLPVATAFAARMIDVDRATGGSLLMHWGRKTFVVGDIVGLVATQ